MKRGIKKKLIATLAAISCGLCMQTVVNAADGITIQVEGNTSEVAVTGVFYNEAGGNVKEETKNTEDGAVYFSLPATEYECFRYSINVSGTEIADTVRVKEIKDANVCIKVVDVTWAAMMEAFKPRKTETDDTIYNTVGEEGNAYATNADGESVKDETITNVETGVKAEKTNIQVHAEYNTTAETDVLSGTYTIEISNIDYKTELSVPYNKAEYNESVAIPDGIYNVVLKRGDGVMLKNEEVRVRKGTCVIQTTVETQCVLTVTNKGNKAAYRITRNTSKADSYNGEAYAVTPGEVYTVQRIQDGEAVGQRYKIKIPTYATELYFDFATGVASTKAPDTNKPEDIEGTVENPFGIAPTSVRGVKDAERKTPNVLIPVYLGGVSAVCMLLKKRKHKNWTITTK